MEPASPRSPSSLALLYGGCLSAGSRDHGFRDLVQFLTSSAETQLRQNQATSCMCLSVRPLIQQHSGCTTFHVRTFKLTKVSKNNILVTVRISPAFTSGSGGFYQVHRHRHMYIDNVIRTQTPSYEHRPRHMCTDAVI